MNNSRNPIALEGDLSFLKILIVDDQPTNLRLLRAELELLGHQVLEARDGAEALQILASEPVHAVISDILMPNMDGFELCHRLRNQEQFDRVAFVISTSTYDSGSDREFGESTGADGYFVRPVAVETLLDTVRQAIAARRADSFRGRRLNGEFATRHYNVALISKLEEKNLELTRSNENLTRVRDQLRNLLDQTPALIFSLKIEGEAITPVLVSENIRDLLGYRASEAIDRSWWIERIHPEDRDRVLEGYRAARREGFNQLEYRFRHASGHFVWIRDIQRMVHDAAGVPKEIAGIWLDITARRQTEEKLHEQAALLDIASDAILVEDFEGGIKYWSQGAERMFGWTSEEAIGRLATDFLDKQDLVLWQGRQALLRCGEWSGETHRMTKAGQEILTLTRCTLLRNEAGVPRAILSINTNITERKKLEAQFLRTQRLESIGTLASGIAHDLNNVLTPITMSLQLLQDQIEGEENRQLLDGLAQHALRGAGIINQVLAFSRGVEGHKIPIDPRHLLKEIRGIVSKTFPKNIRFEGQQDPNLWNITADPTQIHQVLLNLCINARDAMPEGGLLRLTARNETLDGSCVEFNPGSAAGPFVVFEVSDTGGGIPVEIQERIFEPFFSTKEVGRGTGLGLSTVSGIVRDHGGFIKLYSEVGRGSVFRVYLPATHSAVEPAGTAPSNLPRGAGETILVVDDEELILKTARRILERYGYQVLTAPEGASAVAIYAQARTEIAVVLTDLVMPVMDGPSLVRALQTIDPGVRVIAASGFGSANRPGCSDLIHARHYLQKPYTADALLNALNEILRPEHA